VNATDWATVASLATALGTLVLAVATFSAIRAANVMARVAQQSMLAGLRPVLMAARRDDPEQKVNFGDSTWVRIPGGGAVGAVGLKTEETNGAPVYLAVALRNAGNGIAVLHGWRFYPGWHRGDQHAPLEEFERQNRDLYIPPGDIGFWQGAFRNPGDPRYAPARKAIEAREPWTVELLYGDHEGGQRAIARFVISPWPTDDDRPAIEQPMRAIVVRYWTVDGHDPR
jgi:hypothetical protein